MPFIRKAKKGGLAVVFALSADKKDKKDAPKASFESNYLIIPKYFPDGAAVSLPLYFLSSAYWAAVMP